MIKNFEKNGKSYAKDTIQNGFSIWLCVESIDGFNLTTTQRRVEGDNPTRNDVVNAFLDNNEGDYDF